MIVMPANNSSGLVHYLAGKYPGKIGWMLAPGGFKEPREWLPYVIDNGKYSSWENKSEWNEDGFFDLLDRCKLSRFKPDWVAVPDEVANRDQTLWLWNQYEQRIKMYGWRLAFVVQDGMTPNDVPDSADVVFVGGSTKWKWRNVALFCATFPRVHVGRVNWVDKLEFCERVGVESCDGTGFFRGGLDSIQSIQLVDFISGHRRHTEQLKLFGT
jgi:hypothetical protein